MHNFLTTIKDAATFIFYTLSIIVICIMIYAFGLIVGIPLIIYVAYQIFKIKQEFKQEQITDEHENTKYTRN